MQISASLDGMQRLLDNLGQYARQILYAKMRAINWTSALAMKSANSAMRADFDRPTPFVLRGLFISYATKERLSSEVKVKDTPAERSTYSLAEKIGQEFAGGSGRLQTRMETAFARAGVISAGEYLVPGPDAVLDRFGNLSRAQTKSAYAALKTVSADATSAGQTRKSRKNTSADGRLFWSHGRGHTSGLRRGLWGTDAQGQPRLVLVVVPKVSYRRLIELDRIAQITVDRYFRKNFERALQRAIETAK